MARAISKEVNRVFVQFAVIKLVTISDYYEMLALYPDQVSHGHIVLAFRATGPGWQSRINDTLAAHVRAGKVRT